METASEDLVVAAHMRELRGHLDASYTAAEKALYSRIPRLLQSAEWAKRDFRWVLETDNPVNELMMCIQKFKDRLSDVQEIAGEENHGLLRLRMVGILEAIRHGPCVLILKFRNSEIQIS